MHGFGGSMGFGMGFGWIFWLVILGVIIWAVVSLVNRPSGSTEHGVSSGESARDILKKRYARGEISREEYQEMKSDLR